MLVMLGRLAWENEIAADARDAGAVGLGKRHCS